MRRRRRRGHPRNRRKDEFALLCGLRELLGAREIATEWHEDRSRKHFMAQVEDDEPFEVHVALSHRPVRRLGRVLLMQAAFPEFVPEKIVLPIANFCDRSNEALYGTKLYLRRLSDDPPMYHVMAERGCLVAGGDLLRLADEFELLVAEYREAREKLQEGMPHEWQMTLPLILGAEERPAVGDC